MTGPRRLLACAVVLAGAAAVTAIPHAGGGAEARSKGVSDGVITFGQSVELSCVAPARECSVGPTRNSIRIVNPRGGPTRRLATCPRSAGLCDAPDWSRDGRKLAFIAYRDRTFGAFLAAPDGRQARLAVEQANSVSFSPEGLRLLVQLFPPRRNRTTNPELYVTAGDGSAPRRITFGGGSFPDWSSRGRIAFVRFRRLPRNRGTLGDTYTIRPDGRGLRRLTRRGGDQPDWSPDGRRLAVVVAPGNERPTIEIIDTAGKHVRTLTRGEDPTWSPTGGRLAFTRGRSLYVINADATGLRRLARVPIGGRYTGLAWKTKTAAQAPGEAG